MQLVVCERVVSWRRFLGFLKMWRSLSQRNYKWANYSFPFFQLFLKQKVKILRTKLGLDGEYLLYRELISVNNYPCDRFRLARLQERPASHFLKTSFSSRGPIFTQVGKKLTVIILKNSALHISRAKKTFFLFFLIFILAPNRWIDN